MKIFITALFLLLPLAGCSAQSWPAENSSSQGQKKIPDPNTWDFKSIKKGEIVKHDFQIKNNLAKTLTINDVTTSCGCTASSAKKKKLAPGEATQITVEFNSKGYKGQTSQFIYVNTDDPADPILKFTIKAFVR